MRRLVIVSFALAALGACGGRTSDGPPLLQYVTTAEQLGPVGYRDPIGVLSPDGEWLAYAVEARVYVQRVIGGPVYEAPNPTSRVIHLVWTPDSRAVVMDRRSDRPRWWLYDFAAGTVGPFFPPGLSLSAGGWSTDPDRLRQLAFSADGRRIAGVAPREGGSELWTASPAGDSATVLASANPLSFPSWAPGGQLACLVAGGGRQTVSLPCGEGAPDGSAPESYGPIAFSPDGRTLYTATPNERGTVDLWARPVGGGDARRLTSFSRDTYAPSVGSDGGVLVKTQTYRTFVADMPAAGGEPRALATFQSETPSWDPTGEWIGVTYGTWRRVIDDFGYPDIAQDAGIIPSDPAEPSRSPARVVDSSPSEDQSMGWSPNGRWIAYHSHKDGSDDVWLVPADGSARERRLTSFGRGFETGWPRWSPDGKWVVFNADSRGDGPRRSLIYLMGVDQETGEVTRPEEPVALGGYPGEGYHAEWLGGSDRLLVHGFEGPDRHALLDVRRDGGAARVITRWRSGHRMSGVSADPTGRWAVYPAPADGHFQLFRVPVAGGASEQLTSSPVNKTQPSYSPDGRRIALTVWEFQVQFWIVR